MSFLRKAIVNGNRIAFYEQGSGAAMVLLHGMFGDHLDWEPVLEPLARSFRVIAPDLPGFGDSDKPDIDYTEDFFLDTLRILLDQLGVKRSILVGNSFGGILAILFAIAHPARVERLVLVSSGGIRPFSPEDRRRINLYYTPSALAALAPPVQEAMLSPIFARESPHRRRYLDKQNEKLTRADFPAYTVSLSRCAQLGASHDLVDRLPEITCPTLFLWGDRDIVFPSEYPWAALPRLRQGEMVLLPGCGHIPQLDDPEAFVSAVENFSKAIASR